MKYGFIGFLRREIMTETNCCNNKGTCCNGKKCSGGTKKGGNKGK